MPDENKAPFKLDVNEERIKVEYTSNESSKVQVEMSWKKILELFKEIVGAAK